MPIRESQRPLYPQDWDAISQRIRERAGDKCETCGVPNHALVARGCGSDEGTYMLEDGSVFDEDTGEARGMARGSEYNADRFPRIVLTVAHLNHDPTDNRDENLRCWCQLHHLRHDAKHHAETARETRRGRKAAGNLPGVQ